MTVRDALNQGYVLSGEWKYERCYVSRKNYKPEDQPVLVAGGRRKGELYFLSPNWKSTTYSFRNYLIKKEDRR